MEIDDARTSYLTKIKEKSKKILDYLRMDELSTSRVRLASDSKMNPKTEKKYLRLLEEFDLIEKTIKTSRFYFFFLKNFTSPLLSPTLPACFH